MKFKILIFIFIITLPVCYGQKGPGENVYSLEQCIETALKNNYDIKLSDARTIASEADVTSAFGNFLPAFRVNSGYSREYAKNKRWQIINERLVSLDQWYNISAGGEWVIFDGFSRENNYKRAHETFNTYESNSKQTKERIKIEIYRDYIDVIAKSQIVKVRKENLELGKKELERIKAQNQAGVISPDIVYSQEADLGNKEYNLVTAQNNLNLSKAVLLITMGLNPDMNVDFLESSLPNNINLEDVSKFHDEIGDKNNLMTSTFENRFDYKASIYNITAAESSLDMSYAGYYPTLSASGGWGWGNIELANFGEIGKFNVGFNISYPLFDQFNTNNRIQTAKLQLEQAKIDQKQLEQNIISSIKTAFLNLEASEKQLEISERALKASEMNNESQKEKFRVGTSSITEFSNANTQLITSQINRVNAVYQYFRAQKEVLYSIGKLE